MQASNDDDDLYGGQRSLEFIEVICVPCLPNSENSQMQVYDDAAAAAAAAAADDDDDDDLHGGHRSSDVKYGRLS